jgi:hypothetical protein
MKDMRLAVYYYNLNQSIEIVSHGISKPQICTSERQTTAEPAVGLIERRVESFPG